MGEKTEEKILAYKFIESRINGLINQRSILVSNLNEIQSTLQSLKEFEKSEEIFFPISSGVYCLGKIVDKKKVIVSIGANIALEKSLEDARDFLNRRNEEIEKALEQVENEILSLQSNLKILEKELEKEIKEEKNV
ncbi:MAG: prefoldin subunit alpha [Candidatus Aenigmatarchaeota archaeon]